MELRIPQRGAGHGPVERDESLTAHRAFGKWPDRWVFADREGLLQRRCRVGRGDAPCEWQPFGRKDVPESVHDELEECATADASCRGVDEAAFRETNHAGRRALRRRSSRAPARARRSSARSDPRPRASRQQRDPEPSTVSTRFANDASSAVLDARRARRTRARSMTRGTHLAPQYRGGGLRASAQATRSATAFAASTGASARSPRSRLESDTGMAVRTARYSCGTDEARPAPTSPPTGNPASTQPEPSAYVEPSAASHVRGGRRTPCTHSR